MFSLLQPGSAAVFTSLSCCRGNRQSLRVRERESAEGNAEILESDVKQRQNRVGFSANKDAFVLTIM